MIAVVDLRCQLPDGVPVIGREAVRLTWRIAPPVPDLVQDAFQVQVSPDGRFSALTFDSGEVPGDDQIGIEAPGGCLASREVRWYRVRVRTQAGWTGWSPSLRVEAGLLDAWDWRALAVGLPDDPGALAQSPAPILRRAFELPGRARRARLYVTSLGLHEVVINGRPVGDALLAPGWTTYGKRLLHETHDVADLLVPGRNVIGATLGDGWYRGRLGWEPGQDRCTYGDQLALLAQLEVELTDGARHVVTTDGAWQASTGEVRLADIYDGCEIDLRERQDGWDRDGFVADGWRPVRIVPMDRSIITPRVAPAVRRVAELKPTLGTRAGGLLQLDAGQNISGFVRLRVRGTRGSRVVVRHAEVLEPDGSLHTRSLRSARASDMYVLADDGEVMLEPRMTFHGFRYAEIATDAQVLEATCVAISSDSRPRASFSCSLPLLERLHENVRWSQLDNCVSLPTDCPQRDERLGWTGDAQAFAATAATLFDSQAFWRSWLCDLALDQDDALGAPTLVPDARLQGEARFGRAGWGDAATIVPWAVFESYGDPAVLREQLDSMRRMVEAYRARLGPDGLLRPGLQFGDWLDPEAPATRPWEARVDGEFLANAFLAQSARLSAEAADLLGDHDWAAEARALGRSVATRAWQRWGSHVPSSQTGCAVALRFGIVPGTQRESVVAALVELVREGEGRVRTGFLGTPLVLPALSDAGSYTEAYRMLLREEVPSWLYQVRMGATTVWERWDAIRPDGSIHPGTMETQPGMAEPEGGEPPMLSFNHYAYGSVIDWVYRHVAGLAPDRARPGYRHVRMAPRPAATLQHAAAAIDAPLGRISIAWRIDEDGVLRADVELPFGSSATFHAPVTSRSSVEVDGRPGAPITSLRPGHHVIAVSHPELAGPT